jgi:alpha-L-fucosidase
MATPLVPIQTRRKCLKSMATAAWVAVSSALLSSVADMGCSNRRPMPRAAAVVDDPRTRWYRDAKFGMFMHWGAYSVAGVEASWPIMKPELFPHSSLISEREYVELPRRFNPIQYEPGAWVEMAKQAGMRYMVITTKHHDGFCMFDAPGTDYKITNTPYRKDVVALLAEACHEQQMPLGFYYSPPDMHHPGFRDTSKPARENWYGEPSRPQWPSYLDYMESHLRTLLTKYGPVAVIWFDGLFGVSKYNPPRFHKLIRDLSPDTLVNDRLGPGGDFVTPEQFFPEGIPIKASKEPGDITPGTFNAIIGLSKVLPQKWFISLIQWLAKSRYPTSTHALPQDFQLWETCMTMNDSWGYNPNDKNFKSPEILIRTLVEVASRGGNFLLNVGPTPQGTVPVEAQQRLRRFGEWMAASGESIYKTTYGPLQNLASVRTTTKEGTIYLYLVDRVGPRLDLAGVPGKVVSVSLLQGAHACTFEQSGDRLRIDASSVPPNSYIPVLAIRTTS